MHPIIIKIVQVEPWSRQRIRASTVNPSHSKLGYNGSGYNGSVFTGGHSGCFNVCLSELIGYHQGLVQGRVGPQ